MLRKVKFKIYRRENINLFLKNTLISDKFIEKISNNNIFFNKKNNFSIFTHYCNQLKEKRKLKIIYGLTDKKYNIYYKKSKNLGYDVSKNILYFLERRLDNFVYRIGMATTRSEARQLINHNFIKINSKTVNISSKILNIGDHVSFNSKKKFHRKDYFDSCFDKNLTPEWTFVNKNNNSGYLKRLPSFKDLKDYINIDSNLILGNCKK